MSNFRYEHDSMGEIQVSEDVLWGAQTQRSLLNFKISTEKMPIHLIQALALVKRAAAKVNLELGLLDKTRAEAIISAADEIIAGQHSAEFPLAVWQTGSGTQTNMNVNEVIANRASEILGGGREIYGTFIPTMMLIKLNLQTMYFQLRCILRLFRQFVIT